MKHSEVSLLTSKQQTEPMRSTYSPFWRVMLLLWSFLTAVFSVYHVVGAPRAHADWDIYITITSIAWFSIYLVSSYRHFRSVYLFTSAYVVVFFVFHLSLSISDALGLLESTNWYVDADGVWLERAGWYAILALGSLGIGFSVSLQRKDLVRTRRANQNAKKNGGLSLAFRSGVGLFIASLIFLVVAIATFGNLLNYSRLDFFRGVEDTRGVGAFLMVFPTSIVLMVIGAQSRLEKYTSYIIFAIGLLVLLLSGYRSMALFPLIAGMIMWVKTGRRIPLVVAAGIFAAAIIAISAIGILRAIGTYGEIDFEAMQGSIKQANLEDVIELGSTAIILANTLRLVPRKDQYWYGLTYLRHVRNALPRVAPGRRDAVTMDMNDAEDVRRLNPGRWITYRLAPWKFKGGEGLGFSAVGEPYINFGLAGVFFFFSTLGFLLGRLDSLDLMRHPRLLVFVALAFWPLLKTVRNDFGVFTKPLVFSLIVIAIWHLATKIFSGSRRA